MTDYTGALCPVCKKNFKAQRPVVCPDCGAPYHPACYAESGKCMFADKHGTKFTWENVPAARDDASAVPHNIKRTESSVPANKPKTHYGSIRETLDEMGFFKDVDERGHKLNHEAISPEERFLFGVSEKEIAHFQGGINPLRLLRYRRIASGNKISLNLAAGFFRPLYLFYSRMRGLGFAVTLLTSLLSFPSLVATYFDFMNLPLPFTQEQLMRMTANLSIFNLSLIIIFSLFFDYIYLRWASNKIKLIRSRFYPDILENREEIPDMPSVSPKLDGLEDEYYAYLQHEGRPGIRYMLKDFFLASLLTFILLHLYVANFM